MKKITDKLTSWKRNSKLSSRSSTNVDLTLPMPCQLEKCDDSGRRPIHDACLSGDMIKTRYLLDHGVDINILTFDGRTALHLATITQNVAIVTLLIREPSILGKASFVALNQLLTLAFMN